MKILFNIGHPAQVHLFKNLIRNLEKRGHDCRITTVDKEVSLHLLNAYGFDYEVVGTAKPSLFSKATEMIKIEYMLYRIAKSFKPDILVGASGNIYIAHVSKLLRKKSIIFEDSEHTRLEHFLYTPFVDVLCTTTSFKKNFGNKQIRYNSYDELAYLHPKYFTPNQAVLDDLNSNNDDKYVLLRFVSWTASHDIGQSGFNFKNEQDLTEFITALEKRGLQVLISSEKELPSMLESYKVKLSPEKIHDVLYFATMYIGEGATMAAEAAVLGTPSIYVSSLPLGYLDELRDKYGLVYTCWGCADALKIAKSLLSYPKLKEEWQNKREKLLKESIDVTEFMVKLIEGYPDSVEKLKYAEK
jgi:predicted glycosyltransferase